MLGVFDSEMRVTNDLGGTGSGDSERRYDVSWGSGSDGGGNAPEGDPVVAYPSISCNASIARPLRRQSGSEYRRRESSVYTGTHPQLNWVLTYLRS